MMSTWIALLRGINVGGKNILPMSELVRDLESLHLENVRTYIQSGNAVFQSTGVVSPILAAQIATRIEQRHGFRPRVLLLSADQLQRAMLVPSSIGAARTRKVHHSYALV